MKAFIIDRDGNIRNVVSLTHLYFFKKYLFKNIPEKALINNIKRNIRSIQSYLNKDYPFLNKEQKLFFEKFDVTNINDIRTLWNDFIFSRELDTLSYVLMSQLGLICGYFGASGHYGEHDIRISGKDDIRDCHLLPLIKLAESAKKKGDDVLVCVMRLAESGKIFEDEEFYPPDKFINSFL